MVHSNSITLQYGILINYELSEKLDNIIPIKYSNLFQRITDKEYKYLVGVSLDIQKIREEDIYQYSAKEFYNKNDILSLLENYDTDDIPVKDIITAFNLSSCKVFGESSEESLVPVLKRYEKKNINKNKLLEIFSKINYYQRGYYDYIGVLHMIDFKDINEIYKISIEYFDKQLNEKISAIKEHIPDLTPNFYFYVNL
jgi:hypothetical protein